MKICTREQWGWPGEGSDLYLAAGAVRSGVEVGYGEARVGMASWFRVWIEGLNVMVVGTGLVVVLGDRGVGGCGLWVGCGG